MLTNQKLRHFALAVALVLTTSATAAVADDLKNDCIEALALKCAPPADNGPRTGPGHMGPVPAVIINNCRSSAVSQADILMNFQNAASRIVKQLPQLPVEPYFRDPNAGLLVMVKQFSQAPYQQEQPGPLQSGQSNMNTVMTIADVGGNPRAVMACFPALREAANQWGKQLLQAKAKADAEAQQQANERETRLNLPINFLGNSYVAYIVVKRCYDARAGYAAVYISEPEMRQAKKAVKLIEDKMKPQLSGTETVEQLWADADQRSKSNTVFKIPTFGQDMSASYLCKQNLQYLTARADKLDPSRTATPKDFD